jgi:hypothetical protein
VGANVTAFVSQLSAPPTPISAKIPEVQDDGKTASLSVATIVVEGELPVEPETGVTAITEGGVESAAASDKSPSTAGLPEGAGEVEIGFPREQLICKPTKVAKMASFCSFLRLSIATVGDEPFFTFFSHSYFSSPRMLELFCH